MGLSRLVGRLAGDATVPVFPVVGDGARSAVLDLRRRDELRLVDSPRPASVLVVAGGLSATLADAATAVHDMVSPPRATVRWPLGTSSAADRFPDAVIVEGGEDELVAAVVVAHRDLMGGRRRSEPALGPDVDPAPWRGVGPYGQGGTGMTGGVPYGRPMAERADDRDGLSLDELVLRIGPCFPRFPPGLVLDVKLHGDMVHEAAVAPGDAEPGDGVRPDRLLRPFLDALERPMPVATLELARARSHLRWVADGLVAHGLDALARRVLARAAVLEPRDGDWVVGVARTLHRAGLLSRFGTAGVGSIDAAALRGRGAGPVARAAGLGDDARRDDPGYRALGFEPVIHAAGDAAARWRQRLAETTQALDLAARAGDREAGGDGVVEGPRGRIERDSAPIDRLLPLLPGVLAGQEWGDAVATVVSLDLDLDEAAHVRSGAGARR